MESKEYTYKGLTINGFLALLIALIVIVAAVYCFVLADNNDLFAIPGVSMLLCFASGMNGFI